MRLRKANLRESARTALEQRGYTVHPAGGAGVAPGAQFAGKTANGRECKLAVRTSTDREIGCTRRPDGRWSTLPRMDEVIVAVPSLDDPGIADVFSFEPQVVIAALDEALALQTASNPKLSYKVPIFISLDDHRRGKSKDLIPGIKPRCNWSERIPIGQAATQRSAETEPIGEFIERVKREYALRNKVDVKKVRVVFSIES